MSTRAIGFMVTILLGLFVVGGCVWWVVTQAARPAVVATAEGAPAPSATPTYEQMADELARLRAASEAEQGGVVPTLQPTPVILGQQPQTGDQAQPAGQQTYGQNERQPCTFAAPAGDPNDWPKTMIELAPKGIWFHRVFQPRLFNEANGWGGADSWHVNLALGHNSGGAWTSHGNPGQIVYRGASTRIIWCLGIATIGQYKEQFVGDGDMPVAINVRIAPNSTVTVTTTSGAVVQQQTSDAGDITVILPIEGMVTIAVDYTTAAPTHESLVWWGPYDRSAGINTVDARQ